jgi:hypothetical protein
LNFLLAFCQWLMTANLTVIDARRADYSPAGRTMQPFV